MIMFKLALNAGHGKNTAGKRCMKKIDPKQTCEWVLNSRICDKINLLLKEYDGIDIIRLDDVTGKRDIALKQRTNTANAYGADFYLTIHHNAGIKGGNGGGIETYVYTNPSEESLKWQNALYNALIKKTGLKGNRSDGTRKANFHECRESHMPCVLVECGFMDSATDVPIILTEDFADKVAEACVEVIVERARLKKKEAKQPAPKKKSKKENKILSWQKAAIQDGFSFPKYGADGKWGNECVTVAKMAVCKKQLVGYKYHNLTRIIQKAVGVTVDGKFGNDTKKAVIAYQKKCGFTGIDVDGCVGLKTWKKILGI
jgi:N-acetylmuramoyl-L-alanine amidase